MSNNKQKLLQYLKSHNFMTVATVDGKPWVANVYYVVDDDFNLYFLSEPQSKHGQDLVRNPLVACSIADSHQKVTDQKIGVQLQGMTKMVNVLTKMRWMLHLWNRVNPGFESLINLKNIQNKVIKGRIYQVKPHLIKFFNESLYGPEGSEVFTSK
ncbi:pyridoxamine 5'-phosphate oxidase family protein [Candidatus Gottesmanbacteria bacterium]|nr:pyridoxamine 5'-phosphate oxidase family protein [Candidatus Gottesmanbacteria bacterium]